MATETLYNAEKLASGSMLRVFNLFANVIVSFLLTPFVVHSLGDRMYGFWTLIGTFIGYYGLLDFGLSTAVTRYVAGAIGAQDEKECNRVITGALFIYIWVGVIAFLVTILLAILSPLIFKNPEDILLFKYVILVLGLSTAINFPMKVFQGILTAQLRFEIISGLQIMSLLFRTCLVVWVLSSGYGVLALSIVTFLAGIPEIVMNVYYSYKSFPALSIKISERDVHSMKKLFSYSSFTFIAQIGDLLRFQLDALVISAYIGLSAVAHFNIASILAMHFGFFVVSCMGVMGPLFSRLHGANDHESLKKVFIFSTRISVCISSYVGFGLIAWGKPFIERWMGPEYLDAYPVLVVLTLGGIFALWQSPSVSLLYATSKHKYYALFNTVEGVINLILSILLVNKYGIFGVALGTFIPMAIIKLILQPIYVCRVSSINYKEYVFKILHTIIIVCLSLIIPLFITNYYVEANYFNLIIICIVSFLIYSGIILLYEFNSTEIMFMRESIPIRIFNKVIP